MLGSVPLHRRHGRADLRRVLAAIGVFAALCVSVLGAGCGACDGEAAPRSRVEVGPWLQLAALEVSSPDGDVSLRRDGDVWRLVGTPFTAEPRRMERVAHAFRDGWVSVEARDAETTGYALGFDGSQLRVRVSPSDAAPVRIEVGRADDDGVWIRRAGADVVERVEGVPARALLAGPPRAWRDARVLRLDVGDVSQVEVGGVVAEREDGGDWHEPLTARSGPGYDLAVDGWVGAVVRARGEPVDACPEGPTVDVVLKAPTVHALSLTRDATGAGCVRVDGVAGFRVDAELAELLTRGADVLASPHLPPLESPRADIEVTVRDGGAVVFDGAPATTLPRRFARALWGVRPDYRAPAWLRRALDWPPPRRVVTMTGPGDFAHRIDLTWAPPDRRVFVRVDGSDWFVARDPDALRTPLAETPR